MMYETNKIINNENYDKNTLVTLTKSYASTKDEMVNGSNEINNSILEFSSLIPKGEIKKQLLHDPLFKLHKKYKDLESDTYQEIVHKKNSNNIRVCETTTFILFALKTKVYFNEDQEIQKRNQLFSKAPKADSTKKLSSLNKQTQTRIYFSIHREINNKKLNLRQKQVQASKKQISHRIDNKYDRVIRQAFTANKALINVTFQVVQSHNYHSVTCKHNFNIAERVILQNAHHKSLLSFFKNNHSTFRNQYEDDVMSELGDESKSVTTSCSSTSKFSRRTRTVLRGRPTLAGSVVKPFDQLEKNSDTLVSFEVALEIVMKLTNHSHERQLAMSWFHTVHTNFAAAFCDGPNSALQMHTIYNCTKPFARISFRDDIVSCLKFHQQLNYLAIGFISGNMKIFKIDDKVIEIASPTHIMKDNSSSSAIAEIAWTLRDLQIISITVFGTVSKWNFSGNLKQTLLFSLAAVITSCLFEINSEGFICYVAMDNKIKECKFDGKNIHDKTIKITNSTITCLKLSPFNPQLAIAGKADGLVSIIDFSDTQRDRDCTLHGSAPLEMEMIVDVAWSYVSPVHVLAITSIGTIYLWDVLISHTRPVKQIRISNRSLNFIDFHKKYNCFIVGSTEGDIYLVQIKASLFLNINGDEDIKTTQNGQLKLLKQILTGPNIPG